MRIRRFLSRLALSVGAVALIAPVSSLKADDNLSTGFAANVVTALGEQSAAQIYDVVTQPDNSVIIAGQEITVGGLEAKVMARLNPDGTPDTAFNTKVATALANLAGGAIAYSVALQSDGGILLAGGFTDTATSKSVFVIRFAKDGTFDTSFATKIATLDGGVGLTNSRALAVQSDGKILVGGSFEVGQNGMPSSGVVRFNADGTPDAAFNTAVGSRVGGQFMPEVRIIALTAAGKILLGGRYLVDGSEVTNLVQMNADGTADSAFAAKLGSGFSLSGSAGQIDVVTFQGDGKIIVGGLFTTLNGVAAQRLVRLNADGSRDTGFDTSSFTSFDGRSGVLDAIVTPEGKILVGGQGIAKIDGKTGQNIVRFNADGSLDSAFNAKMGEGFNSSVNALALQFGESILVGGAFTTFDQVYVGNNSVRPRASTTTVRKLVRFSYVAPTLTAVSPSTVDNLVGGTLTLTGTNLRSNLAVAVGGVACTNVAATSATSMTCTVPAGKAGTKMSVAVTARDGASASLADAVTYSTPAVTSVSPATVDNQRGGTITVTGVGFHKGTTLSVGGKACSSLTIVSVTQMTCVVPAGTAGSKVAVAATFIDGSTSTLADAFSYIVPTVGPQKVNFGFKVGANVFGFKTLVIRIFGRNLYIFTPWTMIMQSSPTVIGKGTVNDKGEAVMVGRIPKNTEPGVHTISIEATNADGSPATASATFTVEADGTVSCISTGKKCGPPAKTGTLPATGGDTSPLWPALGALLLGAALMLVRRVRPTASRR